MSLEPRASIRVRDHREQFGINWLPATEMMIKYSIIRKKDAHIAITLEFTKYM